ncbi:hypothetical protein F889_00093 [Acinetobacter colistiniresistens]|uniref:Uncharacterized protein n=1 Tax=Acinetobacter colistiniresistens TaxID=280145 RepID=N9RCF3_9GAMM|nr:hypothetical protein F889_00093 [Acinetobacter colistiniresistens]
MNKTCHIAKLCNEIQEIMENRLQIKFEKAI